MDACKLILVLLWAMPAYAFDWNNKTTAQVADFRDMEVVCGHPLATHRSFLMVAKEAEKRAEKGDRELKEALLLVFGEQDLADFQHQEGAAFQTTLFGNWLNEVNTNIDLEGGFLMDTAAKFLAYRYDKSASTVDPGPKHGEESHRHSNVWDRATGYTSTNFRHSMAVESIDQFHPITQDDNFDRITENYAYHSISATIQGLLDNLVARAEKRELKDDLVFDKKILTLSEAIKQSVSVKARNPYKDNFRYIDALSNLGGVMHLVQDSSVGCTKGAKKYVSGCIEGDGHGVIRRVGDREQVVSLGTGAFYEKRTAMHEKMDGLYCPDKIEAVYGKNDPAIAGANILREVALAVARIYKEWNRNPESRTKAVDKDGNITQEFMLKTHTASKKAAKDINNGFVRTRYAKKEDRIPAPVLVDQVKKDGGSEGTTH